MATITLPKAAGKGNNGAQKAAGKTGCVRREAPKAARMAPMVAETFPFPFPKEEEESQ